MNPQTGGRLVRTFTTTNDVPRITIMSLRHSFATAAVRSGMNVASVSKWLGHCDVTTTLNKYVRPLLTNLHDDVAIIDKGYEAAAGS
ncbi:MAG: tyrosine-type recombinase/integrase [Coriobacteriia bacterium]|nr:tyrosine-type recombinase/integrase [Coriobacteriia bacterium]